MALFPSLFTNIRIFSIPRCPWPKLHSHQDHHKCTIFAPSLTLLFFNACACLTVMISDLSTTTLGWRERLALEEYNKRHGVLLKK